MKIDLTPVKQRDELVESVLNWWNEHQYDVDSSPPDEDGYAREFNRYNEVPEFVKIAQRIKNGEHNDNMDGSHLELFPGAPEV